MPSDDAEVLKGSEILHATMATQQDLQELLRLQTARRMPIKDAMAQIKALQAVSLRRSETHYLRPDWHRQNL